jgi:diadenosine tetraphosphate (Ap4A) HIT family hydrolase
MSPTVFRQDGYRFFFFSREEPRMHIHVISGDGEAKFWIKPQIELAQSSGYNNSQLNAIESLIKEHDDEIISAWQQHFGA